jgi:hypothetical protein
MSVYGFNNNLEKVPVITLSGTLSVPAGDVGTITWNTSALTNAGIDANSLINYAVLDVLHSYDQEYWSSGAETGYTSAGAGSYPNQIHPFPIVKLDTYSKQITLQDYTGDTSAQTKYYKVRLIKVA